MFNLIQLRLASYMQYVICVTELEESSPALTPTAGPAAPSLHVKVVAVVGRFEVGAIGPQTADVIQLARLLLPSVLPKVEGEAPGVVPARLGTAQQAADRQVLEALVTEATLRDTAIGIGDGLVAGYRRGRHLTDNQFCGTSAAKVV